LRIREAEGECLAAEARALADELPSGAMRERLLALAAAATDGEVAPELEGAAGDLIALSLETGRVRSVHGRAAERALAGLWRETPKGREAVDAAGEINGALAALRGCRLNAIRVVATGPGAYALTVSADDREMNVAFGREAPRLRSINVGATGPGE
jgi:hypothetical protein